jgi:hypothetical protein
LKRRHLNRDAKFQKENFEQKELQSKDEGGRMKGEENAIEP